MLGLKLEVLEKHFLLVARVSCMGSLPMVPLYMNTVA